MAGERGEVTKGRADRTKPFDLDILSEREKEILEYAIEGLTDQQIGNRLKITASTVNSYWVRIRGKLGHLSRTELVSKIVSQRASADHKALSGLIQQLELDLARARERLNNSEQAEFLRIAFEANAEPVFLMDSSGKIILCNKRFGQIFGCHIDESGPRDFYEFFAIGNGNSKIRHINFSDLADQTHIGHEFPIFGIKKTGELFRTFLLVGLARQDEETIYAFTVRPFFEHIEMAKDKVRVIVADVEDPREPSTPLPER